MATTDHVSISETVCVSPAPYRIAIDWGDNTPGSAYYPNAPEYCFTFGPHLYALPGTYYGTITAQTQPIGQETTYAYFTITVTDPPAGGGGGGRRWIV